MSTKVTIQEFDTPDELYAALCQVFTEKENNGSRWVQLTVDDVELTFFARSQPQAVSA